MKKMTHKDIVDGWHPFTEKEINTYVTMGFWLNRTVCDLLDRNAEISPNKLALADDTREVTWKELQTRANRMACHLKRLGVEYGDFFVLQMSNVVEFFYLFFGLNRIGAIPVMGLPRHRMLEVNHEVRLHKAKGICVMAGEKFDFVGMVEEIKSQHPYLKVLMVAGGEAPQGWLSVEELIQREIEKDYPVDHLKPLGPDPNDICCEQLSGGTTGLPKGIPRTHNDYIGEWQGYARLAGYTDESVTLITIPVGHNAAFITMNGPSILLGGTMILTKSPRPKEHFELIERYGVTYTTLIPVQITYWMEANEERKKYDLRSFRIMGSGAQKVRPELVEWCLKELGVDMVNHFGMAEGPMICNRWDSPREPQMNTIGFPMFLDPQVQIRIFNDKNEEVGIGEIGEMVAKGPLNFRGYFRNPEENQKAFDENGFFHSGDLMSRRQDGRFVVEGRKKDMIIRGGENVYPEAIEDLLMKHPKVMNTAVIGMPDYNLGERLCAFVQPKEGESLTSDEVQQYIRQQGIAIFQWPERIEVVKGWPLTAVNKLDKRRLRAYMTTKLFEEGKIKKELGDEYLTRDQLTIDDVISGRIKIDFAGTPV
jgi:2,3-dihydroxybenzoate-AMP ligase